MRRTRQSTGRPCNDSCSRSGNYATQQRGSEAFATLRSGGPSELIDTVGRVEATDPTGRRWPRYKSGDDAAVAFCQW